MAFHPRNSIRDNVKTALINAGFISSSSIVVGGVYGAKKESLPNILVYLGGESISNLYNNEPRNRYLREATLYVVIKTENKNRISAIIEAEDFARNCELALLKPDSSAIDESIVDLTFNSYEVSDPYENSTQFSTQLIFNVKYNDRFERG